MRCAGPLPVSNREIGPVDFLRTEGNSTEPAGAIDVGSLGPLAPRRAAVVVALRRCSSRASHSRHRSFDSQATVAPCPSAGRRLRMRRRCPGVSLVPRAIGGARDSPRRSSTCGPLARSGGSARRVRDRRTSRRCDGTARTADEPGRVRLIPHAPCLRFIRGDGELARAEGELAAMPPVSRSSRLGRRWPPSASLRCSIHGVSVGRPWASSNRRYHAGEIGRTRRRSASWRERA